jgi:transposase
MNRKTVCPSSVGVARPTLHVRGLLGRTEPILTVGGRAVEHHSEAFVGIDVSKTRNAIAIAEGGREGEVRFLGEVDASDESMRRVIKKFATNTGGFRSVTRPVRPGTGCTG